MKGKKYLVGLLIGGVLLANSMNAMAAISGMEGYNHTYLPIGSVVMLEGGTTPAMIMGYAFTASSGDYIYDYCGCAYPTGFEGLESSVCFDQSAVSEVLHLGYMGEDSDLFMSYVDENMEKAKQGSVDLEENPIESEAPAQTEAPAAPEGNAPSVSVDSDDFIIPSPLSDFINKGWSISSVEAPDVLEAYGLSYATLTKDGYEITVFFINKSSEAQPIENCTVYSLDTAVSPKESRLPLTVFNGSVYNGMSYDTLKAYLEETSYNVEELDGFLNIYLDNAGEVCMTIFCDKGGEVWGFNYTDNTELG